MSVSQRASQEEAGKLQRSMVSASVAAWAPGLTSGLHCDLDTKAKQTVSSLFSCCFHNYRNQPWTEILNDARADLNRCVQVGVKVSVNYKYRKETMGGGKDVQKKGEDRLE